MFHSPAWLSALQRTYGYDLLAYTTSPPEAELSDGVVFCRVDSRLTGKRLVSLPFSDHCEPLVDGADCMTTLYDVLEDRLSLEGLDYFELRPQRFVDGACALFRAKRTFCFHQIDLRQDLDRLFAKFHKNSTQRKIRRAVREGLEYAEGRSPALLDAFYHLLILTRRRHHIFPQPRAWFRNLLECFGDDLTIRVASLGGQPIASILTLRHKNVIVYKYGGSDARFHRLGGMQSLFWRTIQAAKQDGLVTLDLGRSDIDQPGLLTFKDRLGAVRSSLTYLRFSQSPPPDSPPAGSAESWTSKAMRNGALYLPECILPVVGSLVYRHVS